MSPVPRVLTPQERFKKLETLARKGDIKAMNILHLIDLKRAGHKAVNLDIPPQHAHRINSWSDVYSYCSSTAGWL